MYVLYYFQDVLTWLNLPKIVLHRKPSEVKVSLDQRTKVAWKPNLHICLEMLVADVGRFRSLLASSFSQKISQPPLPPAAAASKSSEASSPSSTLHINMAEKLSLHVYYGENNSLKVRVPSLSAKLCKSCTSWLSTPHLLAKMNGKQVLLVDKVLLSAVEESDKLSSERQRMEGGTVRTNRCYLVAANQLAFTEPYQFNFSKVFFEEFVGVFKWLKGKYLSGEKKAKADGSLPRDILINIKHFKLELSDDPFEVRLRDNYELKKDEYEESQRRHKVLDERIGEFQRRNLMFPSEKVEELLHNLKKKNAEIYIQVKNVSRICKFKYHLNAAFNF